MTAALALAFALAADATAVALSRGLAGRRSERFVAPLLFGVFQAGMAGIGLAAGSFATTHVGRAHRYVGALLLLVLGVRMLARWFVQSSNDTHGVVVAPEPRAAPTHSASTLNPEQSAAARVAIEPHGPNTVASQLSLTPTPSLQLGELLALAVATSLDAALAGASLPSFATPPAITITLVGTVTTMLAGVAFALGFQLRTHLPTRLGTAVETLGGAILVVLACKIAVWG